MGPMAYKLQLLKTFHIHLVFLVSLLKPYYQNENITIPIIVKLSPFTDEDVVMLEPQKIQTRCKNSWRKFGAVEIHTSWGSYLGTHFQDARLISNLESWGQDSIVEGEWW